MALTRWIASKWLIILGGLCFGILGALLVEWDNPPNMGVCVVCFLRDITGALGLHRAGAAQYIRPEIIGFVLGSFGSAFLFREFRSRGGSAPIVRFMLGAFIAIGALVFLGCPIRALFRLAGGDLNGITALAGIAFGVLVGILFLKRGFNLGRSAKMGMFAGWVMPVAMIGLLILAIAEPSYIFETAAGKGPGAFHAALGVSLAVGVGVGVMAQRTRFCTVGGWRDVFLTRDTYLFSGIAALLIGALVTNAIMGNIDWGFANQPIAHDGHLWNFFSMTLVGLAATLLGGCPLRQLILSGEGDTDAGVTVLGLIVGVAFAHNFLLASSASGTSDFGPIAVIVGLVFCVVLGFAMRDRA
jgi:YedE family putative selenium metabolism protein